MGNQTPVDIYIKYCTTYLYYNFIIKNYPYYVTKSQKNFILKLGRVRELLKDFEKASTSPAFEEV